MCRFSRGFSCHFSCHFLGHENPTPGLWEDLFSYSESVFREDLFLYNSSLQPLLERAPVVHLADLGLGKGKSVTSGRWPHLVAGHIWSLATPGFWSHLITSHPPGGDCIIVARSNSHLATRWRDFFIYNLVFGHVPTLDAC